MQLAGDPQHSGHQFRADDMFSPKDAPKVRYLRPASAQAAPDDVWTDCDWIAAILPLPTGPNNLQRLKRLFRYDNLRRYYPQADAGDYLEQVKARLAQNPRWFEEEVAALGVELAKTPHYVYSSRDKGMWAADMANEETTTK